MRSKEVEKAIDFVKFYKEHCLNIENSNIENYETINDEEFIYKNLDTVLNYISKLEKENIHWRGKYHLLSRKIDVTPNDVIREEMKKLYEKASPYDCDTADYKQSQYMGGWNALRKLLEGE